MVGSVRFSTSSSLSRRSSLERDLLGAVITGQAAGFFMLVTMMVSFTVFLDKAWYHPVQVIGAFALGDEALGAFSFTAFSAGLVIHQLIASFAWSLAFGALINKAQRTVSNVLALGLALGVASQIAGAALIAPTVMGQLHGHNIWAEQVPQTWSWIAHLVFGASFLLYIPVRQVLRRRAYSLGV